MLELAFCLENNLIKIQISFFQIIDGLFIIFDFW